jgi:hypothetical protein
MALGRGSRRALLVVHIVSSGAWIGIDVIVAVLVATGWFAGDLSCAVSPTGRWRPSWSGRCWSAA